MDDLTTEIRENVSEIENIPAAELPQGCEWRPCKDCETLFIAPIGSKKKYCPVCLEARFAVSRSKGGKTPKKVKPVETDADETTATVETTETTEKENQNMPIRNTLPELHKCAVCGNDFLTTKNEPMCVQCRTECAPAKPVETCLTGKPAYHVVVREPAPAVAPAAENVGCLTSFPLPKPVNARNMLRVAIIMETIERTAEEWGTDVDTVLDTITEGFGMSRALENRKSRCAKEG